jgi:hypothetical protein
MNKETSTQLYSGAAISHFMNNNTKQKWEGVLQRGTVSKFAHYDFAYCIVRGVHLLQVQNDCSKNKQITYLYFESLKPFSLYSLVIQYVEEYFK